MEIKEMTAEEYGCLFDSHVTHIYNTVRFNELNRAKADSVRYLALVTSGALLGIILGERDGKLLSPFSAPFGGMTGRKKVGGAVMAEAWRQLHQYGAERGLRVEITLPPVFYAPEFIGLQEATLAAEGLLMWEDVNYHRLLDFGEEGPAAGFSSAASRAMRHAERAGLEFHLFEQPGPDEIHRVYEVVRANHHSLGYPVKMSEVEVAATAPVTGSRFMIVTLGGEDVAAAMFNSVTPHISQLIYWGDELRFRPLRPMNLLAAGAFGECRRSGFSIADLGPAAEFGVSSPGLCRFKESLGCTATAKRRFVL